MSNRTRVQIACIIALFATGCANQRPCVSPDKAPAPAAAAPVAKTSVAQPPAQLHETFITALSPKDAANRAAKAVNQKLGLMLEIGLGNSYAPHFDPSNFGSDHFSSSVGIATQAGKTMHIEYEWLAEGKTMVTLHSDLPKPQYDLVVRIIREADSAHAR